MKKNISRTAAILQLKCPKCRRGNMFLFPLAKWHKFNKMHEHCPCCGLRFEREPGFYFGAMYFSYGFNIALMIGLFITLNLLFERPPLWVYLVGIIGPSMLLVPANMRISRALMLHLFGGVGYEGEPSEEAAAD